MIKLYNMDVMKALKQMKSESISCVMTSPPYWALRDYGKEVEAIWDAKEPNRRIKDRRLFGI